MFVTNDRKPNGWMEHVAGIPVGAHSQLVKDMEHIAMLPGRSRRHLVEEVHTDDIHARLAELDHPAG